MIEIGISIIAACLPILRPLFSDAPLESFSRILRNLSSLRSTTFSIFWRGRNSKYRKNSESASNSSRTQLAYYGKENKTTTEIYNIRDLEAQAGMPSRYIMSQTSSHKVSRPIRSQTK